MKQLSTNPSVRQNCGGILFLTLHIYIIIKSCFYFSWLSPFLHPHYHFHFSNTLVYIANSVLWHWIITIITEPVSNHVSTAGESHATGHTGCTMNLWKLAPSKSPTLPDSPSIALASWLSHSSLFQSSYYSHPLSAVVPGSKFTKKKPSDRILSTSYLLLSPLPSPSKLSLSASKYNSCPFNVRPFSLHISLISSSFRNLINPNYPSLSLEYWAFLSSRCISLAYKRV